MKLNSVLLMCLFLTSGHIATAQSHVTSAELRGSVTDASGAVLSASLVRVRNSETGQVFSTATNASGEYRIVLLPPGIYEIRVEKSGFASQVRKAIPLTVGQIAIVDVRLEIGSINMVVEVTETLPFSEPDRTQQSHTIDERSIRQLPIDRRDYLSYALLAPGVVDADALANANDFRILGVPHTGLSFQGGNGRGNSVKIDGASGDDVGGGFTPMLSQEAVREFQINTANYSAQLG